jgi:hypothetical protein
MATSFTPDHNIAFTLLNWAGIDLTQGLAEDNGIVFNLNSEQTEEQADAGGREFSVSVMGNNSGTIELTYNTQSVTNKLLAEIADYDRSSGTITRSNMTVVGNGTAYLYQPKACHIKTRPNQSIGKTMNGNTQTWIFFSPDMNKVDIDDFTLNVDLKAQLTANVNVAISLSI